MKNQKLSQIIMGILPKSFISRVFGYIALIPLPPVFMNMLIRWYSKKFGVSIEEAVIPEKGFKNLNSFFTRKLKDGVLIVDKDEKSVVATTDSRIDEFGDITEDIMIQAKGLDYSLRDLIPSVMAESFIDGKFITLYLSPGDYHRIHSPVSGKITGFYNIPGKLYSVQESVVKSLKGLFVVNERLVTYIDTGKGMTAVCKIGALNVGKISIPYDNVVTNKFLRKRNEVIYPEGKEPVINKGEEVGVFNMGSTVIILFEKGMIDFKSFKRGEKVRVGQAIGYYKK
ncbi:MAG: archaetidylserine decarboxylase [Spirochaetota bacterium]